MNAEEFRDIALSMDGAVERAHMGHPDFRAGGKIFASLHADEKTGVVKLTPDEQREFMRMYPRMFAPASGAWGRQGWTHVILDAADARAARSALMLAWQNVAASPRTRPRARTPGARRPKRR